ncbi:MAG: glucosaminidase domain-containing protein, partial [Alphaproteobacteria bacterium]
HIFYLIVIIGFFAGLISMDRKIDKILQSIEYQEEVQEESQINTPNCLEILSMVQEIGKEDISENKVISLMIMLGIEHPHIVYAQMRLESGNFKSTLAIDCNNFFGMKHPKNRANVSLGANSRGFATYDNWAMSVLDYGLWQKKYASGLTEEEYYGMLSKHYSEDSDYCTKVSNIISNIDFNLFKL